jgi:effector-binding domain-containing protein
VDEQDIRLIDHPGQAAVGVRRIARPDELPQVFSNLLPRVAELLDRLGARPAGPPYGRYRDRTGDDLDVEVGFPVDSAVGLPQVQDETGLGPQAGVVVAEPLPASRVVETVHAGAYDGLPATYARLESWIAEHHLRPLGESWELYEAGPESDPDPTTWRTRVVVAVTGPAVEAPRSSQDHGRTTS